MRYTTFLFSNMCENIGVKVDNAAFKSILRCQFVVVWLSGVLKEAIATKLFTVVTFEQLITVFSYEHRLNNIKFFCRS